MTAHILFLVMLGCAAGACAGSFADAAAMRTVGERKWWGAARSECGSCGTVLAACDLVPVVSFILLGGRCRKCGGLIPRRHLVTEVISAVLGALFACSLGFSYALLFSFTALVFLMFHALTDIESGYIYDAWALAMAAAGFLLRLPGGYNALISGASGAALGFSLIYAIVILSRGGMGTGDAMLSMGIGALLGWKMLILSLYIGFMSGGLVVIPLLVMKKISRRDIVPLGPFLAAGGVTSILLFRSVFGFLGADPGWPWSL